jgi:hypothetical protein
MNSFVDLAIIGKPEALKKFLPSVESLLPPEHTATARPRTELSRGFRIVGVASSDGGGFLTI